MQLATFRNCQVAAPLKRPRGRSPARGRVLPQLSSCGPIEASLPVSSRRRALPFRNCQVAAPLKLGAPSRAPSSAEPLPQLSSCGPIEARPWCIAEKREKLLPQLSSCGPIEARLGEQDAGQVGAFRNCQVAAPLKPDRVDRLVEAARAFRNCQVAAPLKLPRRCRDRRRRQIRLPQLSSCGPIEARP